MHFDLQVPPLVKFGAGSVDAVGELATIMGVKRPIIVTDSFLATSGVAERVANSLRSSGHDVAVFSETIPDPTTESLAVGLGALQAHSADSIVALGGGSPIDTAKALAVLAIRGGAMSELKAPYRYSGPALPILAIPTTAGTGSEATMFTIITDSNTDEKMLCIGPSYLPSAAIVDYELTVSMPPRLTADTGIDALTHAVEAFVSKRANVVSDLLALDAISRIGRSLRPAYLDGADVSAREQMMIAATLAGMAFSNSSVALVHGMSRPLGAAFHLTHGMSNAMLFAEVTAFSVAAAPERYAACARALGVASLDESDASASDALVGELRTLADELCVPTPSGLGFSRESWEAQIPTMAAQALASGSPSNNPRVPNVAEIEQLYRAIYGE